MRGTHESFVGRQGSRDIGEQEGDSETPLHGAGGGWGGVTAGLAIRTNPFILLRIDARRLKDRPWNDSDRPRL
jgi:hypothetical protein